MVNLVLQNYYILIIASQISVILYFILRPIALKNSLVDKPDSRKKHTFITPTIGGICIFLSSICSVLIFFMDFLSADLIAFFIGSVFMLFLGIVDDKYNLLPNIKLFVQGLITVGFIIYFELSITSLGTPLGFVTTTDLGIFSFPFTLIAILGLTNAINMIDGCDGLAASLVAITLLVLSYFGYEALGGQNITFLLIVSSTIIVFLFFNFSKNKNLKVFLGDGGSLFLGFFTSVCLIKFAETDTIYDPSIVLWFIAIPIFDLCTVIIRRLLLKRKITAADRSHIHHFILSMSLSHFQTSALIVSAALALIFLGVLITTNYEEVSLLVFLAFFILYLSFRLFAGRK